jgi:hypothetical protein
LSTAAYQSDDVAPAGGGNKAFLDSGVFRALVMLLATGRFLHMPELRCA